MGNASKERVDLIRKVYSKTEYPKIIDTKFSQLGVISIPNQIDATFTVEQFSNNIIIYFTIYLRVVKLILMNI